MKKVLVLLFATIMLVGCGSSKKETICKGVSEYGDKVEVKFTSKADEIIKETMFYSYKVEEANKAAFLEESEGIAVKYKNAEGLTFSYKDKGAEVEETYVIDYDKISASILKDLGIADETFLNGDYFSLKKTIDNYEEDTYVCK